MSQTPPPAPHLAPHLAHARNDWYAVADANSMAQGQRTTRLLGEDIHIDGSFDAPVVTDATGRRLPTEVRFDHLWTTLGDDPRPLFEIPEGDEPGRRHFPCGMVRVRCSP